MKQVKIGVAVLCLASMAGSPGAFADGKAQPSCHEVDADFTSELTNPQCIVLDNRVPVGLAGCVATGVIRHDSLLKGTMVVKIPASNPIPTESGPVFSVSGTRRLHPRRGGSLTAHVVGVFDMGRGAFSELNAIGAGTGPFAGATGLLSVFGQAVGPTTFAGWIRGTVCVP
jgi:hypothetical protein